MSQSTITQVKVSFKEILGLDPIKANVLATFPYPELQTANFNAKETWQFIGELLTMFESVQLPNTKEAWLGEVQENKQKSEQDKRDKETIASVNGTLLKTENKNYSTNIQRLNKVKPLITIRINDKTYHNFDKDFDSLTVNEFYELLSDNFKVLQDSTAGSISRRILGDLPNLNTVYRLEIITQDRKLANGRKSQIFKHQGRKIMPSKVWGDNENASFVQLKPDTIARFQLWETDFDPLKHLISIKINDSYVLMGTEKISAVKLPNKDQDTLDRLIEVKAKQFTALWSETATTYSKTAMVAVPQSNYFYRFTDNGLLPITLKLTNKGSVLVKFPYYQNEILIAQVINNKMVTKIWKDTTAAKISKQLKRLDKTDEIVAELKSHFGGQGLFKIVGDDCLYQGKLVARRTIKDVKFKTSIQYLNHLKLDTANDNYDFGFIKCDHISHQIRTMLNKFNQNLLQVDDYHKAKIKDINRSLGKILPEFLPAHSIGKATNICFKALFDMFDGEYKAIIAYLMPILSYVKGKGDDDLSFEQFKVLVKTWLR